MTRTGSPDEDYGCCGQLLQGIDDTIYAYGGDNEVNGFNSDYDPLEEALYKPGGLYGPPADPDPDYDPEDQEDEAFESEYIPDLDFESESEYIPNLDSLRGRVQGL